MQLTTILRDPDTVDKFTAIFTQEGAPQLEVQVRAADFATVKSLRRVVLAKTGYLYHPFYESHPLTSQSHLECVENALTAGRKLMEKTNAK